MKDQHDQMVRNQNKAELAQINELRQRIEKYTQKAKEAQIRIDGELRTHQTLNKALIG